MGGENANEKQTADASHTAADGHPRSSAPEIVGLELAKARLKGGAPPADIADAIAKHPADRDAILVYLHQTAGNGYVQQVVAALADPCASKTGADKLNATTDPAHSAQTAIELVSTVESTLFPAYRRAVDALDAAAAMELAAHVVQAVRGIEHGQKLVSTALSISPDAVELRTLDGALRGQFKLMQLELLTKIGPQYFRGASVTGDLEVPHPGTSVPDYVAWEAGTMVELLAVIKQVDGVARPGNAMTDAQRQQIVALIQPWHSRPANFAFLARVLRDKGIWAQIDHESASGSTLATMERNVGVQRHMTGALADVGPLDTFTLRGLLHTSEGNGSDDERAGKILDGLWQVSASSRGSLLHEIHRTGQLEWFCEHVPRNALEELNQSLIGVDVKAAVLLNPYTEGKGGGTSMRQIYMEHADDAKEHGDLLGAAQWFLAEQLHNTLTFGFERDYSSAREAHEQGTTTTDEFESSATKALGRAAVIAIATSLSGGAAGAAGRAFGRGLAQGIGASESVAQVIAGGVGGFGAGVGGHFAGDLYDQNLNGKQGFDSVGEYMKSGAAGGIAGAVLAGVSVGAGKYLGEHARPVDVIAMQRPQLAGVLERLRAAGLRVGEGAVGAAARVKVTVAELVELVDSGLATAHGGRVEALVSGPGIRRLPATQEIEVSLKPMAMSTSTSTKDSGGKGGQPGSTLTPEMIIDDLDADDLVLEALSKKDAAYEDAKAGGRYADDLERYRQLRSPNLVREVKDLRHSVKTYEDFESNPERWRDYAKTEELLRSAVRGNRDQLRMTRIWLDLAEGALRERNLVIP